MSTETDDIIGRLEANRDEMDRQVKHFADVTGTGNLSGRLNKLEEHSLENWRTIGNIFKRLEAIELTHRKLDQYAIETRKKLEFLDHRFGVLGQRFNAILDGPEPVLTVSDKEVLGVMRDYYGDKFSILYEDDHVEDMRKALEQFLKERL